MSPTKSLSLFALIFGILSCPFTHAISLPRNVNSQNHWVDTWTAMPQLTEYTNLPNPPFNQSGLVFFNSTIRQTLHMSIGGSEIRLRFSNAFGPIDLPITKVTVALPSNGSAGDPAINTRTLQTVTFSGSPNYTIPNGALVVSDPLKFSIKPQSELTVTMYLATGQATNYITSHPGSRTNTYYSFGDYVDAYNLTDVSTQSIAHWYFVSAVEAWASPQSSAFIIVGDSITDGRGSDTDMNNRWPDLLLARMQKNPFTSNIGVNNQAAGGNRILYDGLGPNALGRIDRDVLAQSSVKYAMIFEGVNDIGDVATDPYDQEVVGTRIIDAYKQIIARVHTFGIPMFAGTITPFSGNVTIQPYSDPVREQTRHRVNAWIKNSVGKPGGFDYVVDFAAVVADPSDPDMLNPTYNSGDFLHPNVTGYEAMANAFDLRVFQEFAGGVSTYQ